MGLPHTLFSPSSGFIFRVHLQFAQLTRDLESVGACVRLVRVRILPVSSHLRERCCPRSLKPAFTPLLRKHTHTTGSRCLSSPQGYFCSHFMLIYASSAPPAPICFPSSSPPTYLPSTRLVAPLLQGLQKNSSDVRFDFTLMAVVRPLFECSRSYYYASYAQSQSLFATVRDPLLSCYWKN
jgi:hypothetical protein